MIQQSPIAPKLLVCPLCPLSSANFFSSLNLSVKHHSLHSFTTQGILHYMLIVWVPKFDIFEIRIKVVEGLGLFSSLLCSSSSFISLFLLLLCLFQWILFTSFSFFSHSSFIFLNYKYIYNYGSNYYWYVAFSQTYITSSKYFQKLFSF